MKEKHFLSMDSGPMRGRWPADLLASVGDIGS